MRQRINGNFGDAAAENSAHGASDHADSTEPETGSDSAGEMQASTDMPDKGTPPDDDTAPDADLQGGMPQMGQNGSMAERADADETVADSTAISLSELSSKAKLLLALSIPALIIAIFFVSCYPRRRTRM